MIQHTRDCQACAGKEIVDLVLDRLRKDDEDLIINFEKKYFVKLEFRADTSFHAEQFKIIDGSNNRELASVGEQPN